MSSKFSLLEKIRSLAIVSLGGFGVFAGFSIYNENEKFYKQFVLPAVYVLQPEQAHNLAVFVNKHNLLPPTSFKDPDALKIKLFGKELSNPVGIAAGYDKHGEAVRGLDKMGFGFVEVGSVTPVPQSGNKKPRLFRLLDDQAIINRYGFNSEGHEKVYKRLADVRFAHQHKGVIGVNLGKNKKSEDPAEDYVQGVKTFAHVADYLVVNVSSPNTPGLTQLQGKQELKDLLQKVVAARNKLPAEYRAPILLKLSPDLTFEELQDVVEVVKQKDTHVDGFIVCNTTVKRPSTLKTFHYKKERGGLSGLPLKEASTKMIADVYRLSNGMDIIGVGGIYNGKDAYEKIRAGAKAVQIYTSLIYEGPTVVTKIKQELVELLNADGFKNVSEAVGADVRTRRSKWSF